MSEETKEVKVAIPEGYEIDTEKSTFTNIVFKKKHLSWFESLKQRCHDAYIAGYTISEKFLKYHFLDPLDICVFANEKQAKRARAYAIITQIIKNDDRFGGAITDKEWANTYVEKYGINRNKNHLGAENVFYSYNPIAFHTPKQRDLFLKENEQLLKEYFMID